MKPFVFLALAGTALAAVAPDPSQTPELATWIELVRGVGFPVLAAGYVIYRIEPRIAELSDTLHEIRGYLLARNGEPK